MRPITLLLALSLAAPAMAAEPPADDAYRASIDSWHAGRVERRRRPLAGGEDVVGIDRLERDDTADGAGPVDVGDGAAGHVDDPHEGGIEEERAVGIVARALKILPRADSQNRIKGRRVARTRLTVGPSLAPPRLSVALRSSSIPSSDVAGNAAGEISSPTVTT